MSLICGNLLVTPSAAGQRLVGRGDSSALEAGLVCTITTNITLDAVPGINPAFIAGTAMLPAFCLRPRPCLVLVFVVAEREYVLAIWNLVEYGPAYELLGMPVPLEIIYGSGF